MSSFGCLNVEFLMYVFPSFFLNLKTLKIGIMFRETFKVLLGFLRPQRLTTCDIACFTDSGKLTWSNLESWFGFWLKPIFATAPATLKI